VAAGGLQVMDISSLTLPKRVGGCNASRQAEDIAVSGNYAYVAGSDSLDVIDVSDPADTMRPPMLALPGTTYYRYADSSAVNLSHYSSTCIDPSNPELLWTYQAYGNSTLDKQWCTARAAFSLSSPSTKPKGSTPEIGR
jgi:hypothetical protein